jgi:hypothetical protein
MPCHGRAARTHAPFLAAATEDVFIAYANTALDGLLKIRTLGSRKEVMSLIEFNLIKVF